jgi:hypothetical protein
VESWKDDFLRKIEICSGDITKPWTPSRKIYDSLLT